jgi:hypothetical protein
MKGDAPFMPRGPVFMLDTMWAGAGGPPNPNLLARDAYIEMIRTAQNVADRYGLTRQEIDAFALRSQTHAAAATPDGWQRRSTRGSSRRRGRRQRARSSTTKVSAPARPLRASPRFRRSPTRRR